MVPGAGRVRYAATFVGIGTVSGCAGRAGRPERFDGPCWAGSGCRPGGVIPNKPPPTCGCCVPPPIWRFLTTPPLRSDGAPDGTGGGAAGAFGSVAPAIGGAPDGEPSAFSAWLLRPGSKASSPVIAPCG